MTIYTAIGLMSGTSMDGVDIARIKTDGHSFVEALENASYPYSEMLRDTVKKSLTLSDRNDPRVIAAEKLVTEAHIAAVNDFNQKADVVGFHGQTIFHDPANRLTLQLGDGDALAKSCGMDVVYDFRSADVASGGQGAPFLPLYHQVLVKSSGIELPCAIVNIGGVGNITYIGRGEDEIIAFDTGPGNAMLDDWMLHHAGVSYDEGGQTALSGHADAGIVEQLLNNPYFEQSVPKSLDRNEISVKAVDTLSAKDGAATLASFTVETILKGFDHLPEKPTALYVTGGGRKNLYMMQELAKRSGIKVASVDTLGWNGDAIEAEGFAYLAVRSLLKLPLSLPTTTGVPKPMLGGKFASAA